MTTELFSFTNTLPLAPTCGIKRVKTIIFQTWIHINHYTRNNHTFPHKYNITTMVHWCYSFISLSFIERTHAGLVLGEKIIIIFQHSHTGSRSKRFNPCLLYLIFIITHVLLEILMMKVERVL